jgi:predicted DNA-binding transcriptional regulator YafY
LLLDDRGLASWRELLCHAKPQSAQRRRKYSDRLNILGPLSRKNLGVLCALARKGGLEMTFRVAGLDEIKRWILSFGPEAQILEPAKLKQMVRADLQKSLGQYSANRVYYEISETQAICRIS